MSEISSLHQQKLYKQYTIKPVLRGHLLDKRKSDLIKQVKTLTP